MTSKIVKYSAARKPRRSKRKKAHDPAKIARQGAAAAEGLSVIFSGVAQVFEAVGDYLSDQRRLD